MKVLGIIVCIVVGMLVFTFAKESMLPEIRAHNEVGSTTIFITNGNEKPWPPGSTIILNDAFGGPQFVTNFAWQPGERRGIRLVDFVGLLNKQRYDPKFAKVTEVMIKAEGFRLGSFH